MVEVDTG